MKRALLILLNLILALAAFAQSCPMCKESMTESGEKLSRGFYTSIMSMVFLPSILVMGAAAFIITAVYNKRHPDSNANILQIIAAFVKKRFGSK